MKAFPPASDEQPIVQKVLEEEPAVVAETVSPTISPEDQPDVGAPETDPWVAGYEAAQQQNP